MKLTTIQEGNTGKFFLLYVLIIMVLIAFPVKTQAQETNQEEEEEVDPWADKEFPFDDETLLKFFDANQEVSAVNRQSQERITETVEEHGLTHERFQQIYRASQLGALQDGIFSAEEIEAFNAAAPMVTNLQRENQAMVQMIVEEFDLNMQEYRAIMNEFRRDRELQQYVTHLARERAREIILEERRREAERKMEEERRQREEEGNN